MRAGTEKCWPPRFASKLMDVWLTKRHCTSSGIWRLNSSHMANSDNLSRPTDLGARNALSSAIAMAFLKTFIFPEKFGKSIPEISWNVPVTKLKNRLNATAAKNYADIYTTDLVTKMRIDQSVGRATEATQLTKLYGELYSKPMPEDLVKLLVIAQIVQVLDRRRRVCRLVWPVIRTCIFLLSAKVRPVRCLTTAGSKTTKGHTYGRCKSRRLDLQVARARIGELM
jgi:hypothetical protein